MIIFIIIFLVAIIALFGMVMYRAWEIKTAQVEKPTFLRKIFPEVYFRQTEKIMLYLTKHIVQSIVLIAVKYWFILLTKSNKWIDKNYPKLLKLLRIKPREVKERKDSFVRRAILESKAKIKHIKEKVRRDHAN